MIVNTLFADAKLLGDRPIGHSLEPMHQEYPSRPARHREQRTSISSTQFRRLNPPFLVGRDCSIPRFIQRIQDAPFPAPSPVSFDEQISSRPRQICLGVLNPFERPAAEHSHESFLHQIRSSLATDLASEKVEQPHVLRSVEFVERRGRTGGGHDRSSRLPCEGSGASREAR